MKKLLFIFLSCLSLYSYGQFVTNTNGITITNSTVLSTNGSWQNSGSFLNNGKIITSESWTNSGTMLLIEIFQQAVTPQSKAI